MQKNVLENAKNVLGNAKNALSYNFLCWSLKNAAWFLAGPKDAITFLIIMIIWCFKKKMKLEMHSTALAHQISDLLNGAKICLFALIVTMQNPGGIDISINASMCSLLVCHGKVVGSSPGNGTPLLPVWFFSNLRYIYFTNYSHLQILINKTYQLTI